MVAQSADLSAAAERRRASSSVPRRPPARQHWPSATASSSVPDARLRPDRLRPPEGPARTRSSRRSTQRCDRRCPRPHEQQPRPPTRLLLASPSGDRVSCFFDGTDASLAALDGASVRPPTGSVDQQDRPRPSTDLDDRAADRSAVRQSLPAVSAATTVGCEDRCCCSRRSDLTKQSRRSAGEVDAATGRRRSSITGAVLVSSAVVRRSRRRQSRSDNGCRRPSSSGGDRGAARRTPRSSEDEDRSIDDTVRRARRTRQLPEPGRPARLAAIDAEQRDAGRCLARACSRPAGATSGNRQRPQPSGRRTQGPLR